MASITGVLKKLSNNVGVLYRASVNTDGEEINPATEDGNLATLGACVSANKIAVDVGSSIVSVDLATVDVTAIVDGIAGDTPKTLADLDVALAANEVLLTSLQTLLTAQSLRFTPPVPTPQAAATEDTDAWNELFTIPGNCVFARVKGSNGFYAMAGVTGTDPAEDGVDYAPNIAYDIPCGGANDRLFVKNVTGGGGSDAVMSCTFYCIA